MTEFIQRVEALQFDPTEMAMMKAHCPGEGISWIPSFGSDGALFVSGLWILPGQWVVKDVLGRFTVVAPDTFAAVFKECEIHA